MPRGGFLAPDGSGGQYQNEVETDRHFLFDALDGREGIIRGYVASPDSGTLAWNITPGSAVFPGSETTDQGAYYVWDDVDVIAPADLPDVQSRVDALVIGCRDPQYGALPSGTAPGPFIEVVKGTPAASPVPPTDATIDAAVGPGVWRRWKDFRVDPGDTVIDPVTVTDVDLSAALPLAYARIEQSSGGQVTGNNAMEQASFNTVIAQNRDGFGSTVNQLTIPEPGYYDIKCRFTWDPGVNTGTRYLELVVGGVVVAVDAHTAFIGSGTKDFNFVSYSGELAGGEAITANVFQDSGGSIFADGVAQAYLDVRQRRD